MATASTIPSFYRVFFTWIDPLVSLWSVYMDLFTPDVVVGSLMPGGVHDPQQKFIFQQHGGLMLMIAILSACLLRTCNDLKVWTWYQGSVLAADVLVLYSIWDALSSQGRLSVAAMRAEDWGCVAITGFVTVLRTLFLARFGFKMMGARKSN